MANNMAVHTTHRKKFLIRYDGVPRCQSTTMCKDVHKNIRIHKNIS